MIKPDLSTASLHVINSSRITPHDFKYVMFSEYSICEDALVCCYSDYNDVRNQVQTGVYTELTTTARSVNDTLLGGPEAEMLLPDIGCEYALFSCPASGRFLRVDSDNVAVLDFF